MKENDIDNKVKKMLGALPEETFREDYRKRFVGWLFNVTEDKGNIFEHISVRNVSVFSGAAAAVLLTAFFYIHMLMPVYPIVGSIKGTVKIYRAGRNEWMLARKPKIKLGKNDIVKTFKDGQADILVPGLYHARLKRDSEIRLTGVTSRALAGNVRYSLAKGKLFTNYRKARGDKQFNIDTEEASVSVVGTEFMVAASPVLNQTWVGVLDGTVKVTGLEIGDKSQLKNTVVFVEPGEKTVVRKNEAPTVPDRLMENELLELEELYRIGKKPQVALLISTGKSRTRELLLATPLYTSSGKPSVLSERMLSIARTFNQALKSRSREKFIENIKQFEDLVNRHPDPKYDVQLLLFIGAYYERLGEHEKAIETFQRVIDDYPESNLRSIAQCAIGIIYEEKLNNPEKAKEAYRKILSLYPGSPEAEEAQAGLKRLSR